MASNPPPPFLLPPHILPAHILETHRLWPLQVSRYGFPDIEENGRRYQGFRRGIYPFPCDEDEQDRLDLFHRIFFTARRGRLHVVQLPPTRDGERRRILDLGTGTGVWVLDMAKKYPDAEIVGLDLVNIQPKMIPRNIRFSVPFDIESPWFLDGEKPWDFIHMRCMLGSVKSWAGLYQKVFQRLKPNGVFEQVEIDLQPLWENNGRSFPRDHPLQRWYDSLLEATTRAGRSIGWRQDIGRLLRSQGLVQTRTQVIKLPVTARVPPHGPTIRKLAHWYTVGLVMSLEALTMGPLTQSLGWSVAEVRQLLDAVAKSLRARNDANIYHNL